MSHPYRKFLGSMLHRAMVVLGAVSITLLLFFVLPLMQAITDRSDDDDSLIRDMTTANVPPPPPPIEEEPEKEEEEPEEEPPELEEEAPPKLDLLDLSSALHATGEGWGIDSAVKLNTIAAAESEGDSAYSLADLDQTPRALHQPYPVPNAKTRKKSPGKVEIIFFVDEDGKVETPTVRRSDDPVFDKPALDAVKRWRFEPGKRGGKAVRFRMSVPITFSGG